MGTKRASITSPGIPRAIVNRKNDGHPIALTAKPVIGPAPRHRGLWFNFGHAHQGFTLGPVSGRLLAELIDGEAPLVDPAPYAAQRFER